ncbi:glycoside hydrolase 43 family protein [Polaribacter sejongensis]|uniref:Glycoside hydrolase 43 family protein n=1 Tax=Polaribacter sejongensis TaxID=985043 RepID=A0AAJ1VIY8_9FLAO|nr:MULTISPECIES: glycoside hydrolase family 43 protein [Polaribacter]AUC21165.1 glycoside hydrolase 43 family protein [Polaribacter sejongensis]MDN3620532.1 glycoside hydrolase family 43 protein [Polaribacter undariae]UWD31264.1 glycoside hydrolase family 43 protein [Polaribacter undariae]
MKKCAIAMLFVIAVIGCTNKKEQIKAVKKQLNTFSNPILQGFYPDPSICKVDDSYYLINSTFAYFPGIPIFKSDDLVNWKQIGNALDRVEQLDLEGLEVSQGVFAPAISYHNGVFYIINTIVGGKNNFIISASDPAGPWSNPTWLPKVEGIDPSMFFDKDDKTYVVFNSNPPNNSPEYDGHRTIKIIELDVKNLKTVGEAKIIINKGAKPEDKPIWIEGPHIYNRNGFYYVMAAEGGTAEEHSEVVFRSKNILGPYKSYKNNPILTQRNLDVNRQNPITSTGHADIIKDINGNWWGVFLGCRPYNKNYFNTGRETFMAPVKWKNDWPVFDLEGDVVKDRYQITLNKSLAHVQSVNADFIDEFNADTLAFDWLFLRTPKEKWYSLLNGELTIKTRPETTSGTSNPSFIGYRQKHLFGQVTTNLSFKPVSENEKAGLIALQNEMHYYYLCKSLKDNTPVVQLLKSTENGTEEIAFTSIKESDKISFKIEAKGTYYNFYYSINNTDWQVLNKNVDARFLSTKQAGGFVGTIYGMYTTSSGNKSKNKAVYHWFKNKNIN